MAEDTKIETWEAQTESTVYVYKRDRRNKEWRAVRVGGNGSQRVRLSAEERAYNEELIPEENAAHNPFRNGRLLRVDSGGGGTEGAESIITYEDLLGLLATEDQQEFSGIVAEVVDDELTLRRLLQVAATDGRMWQVEILRDTIDDRYKVGKSQRTVMEMMQGPEGLDEVVTS